MSKTPACVPHETLPRTRFPALSRRRRPRPVCQGVPATRYAARRSCHGFCAPCRGVGDDACLRGWTDVHRRWRGRGIPEGAAAQATEGAGAAGGVSPAVVVCRATQQMGAVGMVLVMRLLPRCSQIEAHCARNGHMAQRLWAMAGGQSLWWSSGLCAPIAYVRIWKCMPQRKFTCQPRLVERTSGCFDCVLYLLVHSLPTEPQCTEHSVTVSVMGLMSVCVVIDAAQIHQGRLDHRSSNTCLAYQP